MGVYFNKERNMWHAKLYYNGQSHHLGYFLEEWQADVAIDDEKKKIKKTSAAMGNIQIEHKDEWNKKSHESLKAISAGIGTKYTYVKPGARTPNLNYL